MAKTSPSGPAGGMAMVKSVLNETVGPMGVLTAGAFAFMKYTAGAALNAEKMAAALRASGGGRDMEQKFKVLMGSAEAARKKVEELSREAAKSPFAFEALGKAAMTLQVVSNGAFTSSKALKQVQDIAVATGTPVDAVAAAMGGLVGALKSGGDGAGSAAGQLASMGAISQDTAEKVAALSAAGAPVGEAMRLVEADTAKAKGAAKELAGTLGGLQQQMENLQNASDAKIGDMFMEGEKAGLRAALSMQKFTNTVQEAASGPWAGLLAAFNAVKEALGGWLAQIADTGAVKAFFAFLGSVAIAVMGPFIYSLVQGALFFGGLAIKAIKATKAIQGLTVVTRIWSGLMSVAGLATLGAAAVLIALATAAYSARTAVNALVEAQRKQRALDDENTGAAAKTLAAISNPEEKKEAIDAADAAVEEAEARLDAANKKSKKDTAHANATVNVPIYALWSEANAHLSYASAVSANTNLLQRKMERDRLGGVEEAQLGLDATRDKQARDRMDLEKSIRDGAYASIQASASPLLERDLADSGLYHATRAREIAESDSRKTYEESTALNDATSNVQLGEKDSDVLSKGIDGIMSAKATTNVSELNKKIAIAETLQAMMGEAKSDEAEAEAGGRFSEQQNAIARREMLQGKINEAGGDDEISYKRIQEMKRERDFAMKEADPTRAMAEEERARAKDQEVRVAAAAYESSLSEKGAEARFASAMDGVDSSRNSSDRAEAESKRRTDNLKKAAAAAWELEAAEKKLSEAKGGRGEDAARKKVEKAQEAAAAAGAKERGVAELRSALAIEQQILETNRQQEETKRAASEKRMLELNNELRNEKMIAQLKVSDAKGETGKMTEAGIKEKMANAEIVKEGGALTAAVMKEAAEAALLKNPEGKNEKLALFEANKDAERRGVDGRDSSEIGMSLSTLKTKRAADEAARIERSRNEGDRMRISALRVQEKYGGGGAESQAAKKMADALDDKLAKAERTKEIRQYVKDPKQAEAMAGLQVDRERALSGLAEAGGAPRVSEMASVGGSAGWAGLVNDPTKVINELKSIAEKQRLLLVKADERDAKALALVEAEIKKANKQ